MQKDSKKLNVNGRRLILKCHPLLWWINFIIGFSLSIFVIVVTIKFIIIKWPVHATIASCFFLIPFYLLLSLPRKIIVDDYFINIIWPWKECHLSRNRVKSIKVKKHRLKSVFIVISLKGNLFCNFIPIRFDWNFQPEDYSHMLKEIEEIVKNE